MADERDDILEDGDYEAAFNNAADNADSWQEPPADADEAEESVVETQPTEKAEVAAEPEPKTSPEVEQIEQKLANMEKLLAEAAKRAEPQKPAEAPKHDPDADEDAAALAEMAEDWPTLHRAMNARIKQLEAQLSQALGTIEQRIRGEFAPVTKVVAENAQERFLQTIHSRHADASDLLPEVEKWITTQPRILQSAYNAALDAGTAQDVIELYDTFKAVTGRDQQQQQQQQQQQPARRQPSQEQRLQQMEGVKAERTGVPVIGDDDFEGAFERAARSN